MPAQSISQDSLSQDSRWLSRLIDACADVAARRASDSDAVLAQDFERFFMRPRTASSSRVLH